MQKNTGVITCKEMDELIELCKRKMKIAGVEDKESYLPLLLEDEIKDAIFRNTVNDISVLMMEKVYV